MIQGDADVEWKTTNVFVHLRRQFNVSETTLCAILWDFPNKSQDDYNRLMEEFSPSPEESEATDEPEVTTPRHDPAAVSKSQANAIYQLLGDLKEEGHLAKRRLHLDFLTERLSERFSFSKEDAQKIIAARASAVLEMMDEPDEFGFRWTRYVIHRELTNAASKSAPLPPALLTPLNSAGDSSDEERFVRTQKSVLRPKVSTISNKVTGKRNRPTSTYQQAVDSVDSDDSDEQDDTDEMEDIDTPSKVRGHDLIRDPISDPKSRARSVLSASSSGAGSSLMKSLFKDKLQTPSVSSSTTRAKLLSPKLPSPERDSTPVPELSQETEEPKEDPPGPWTCRMPGCTTTFSMPAGDERKQLIGAHAGDHDWEMQMKIELMEQEKRMHSSLPLSNLMQYVLDQHIQFMRTAFPEIYNMAKENGIVHDQESRNGESSISETEQPDEEHEEDEDDEEEELDDLVNSHS